MPHLPEIDLNQLGTSHLATSFLQQWFKCARPHSRAQISIELDEVARLTPESKLIAWATPESRLIEVARRTVENAPKLTSKSEAQRGLDGTWGKRVRSTSPDSDRDTSSVSKSGGRLVRMRSVTAQQDLGCTTDLEGNCTVAVAKRGRRGTLRRRGSSGRRKSYGGASTQQLTTLSDTRGRSYGKRKALSGKSLLPLVPSTPPSTPSNAAASRYIVESEPSPFTSKTTCNLVMYPLAALDFNAPTARVESFLNERALLLGPSPVNLIDFLDSREL